MKRYNGKDSIEWKAGFYPEPPAVKGYALNVWIYTGIKFASKEEAQEFMGVK